MSNFLIVRSDVSSADFAIPMHVDGRSNAALVALKELSAGEVNRGSALQSYLRVRPEGYLTTISFINTPVLLGGGVSGDSQLSHVQFVDALAGTCAVAGFTNHVGSAQTITFPASSTPGERNFGWSVNSGAPLSVTVANSADLNKVFAVWRAV